MNDLKKNRCFIFDIDGTLFDTKAGIICAIKEVSQKYGYVRIDSVDESSFIGPPIMDTFIRHYGMSEDIARKATADYRDIYVEKYIKSSKFYDGYDEVLNSLKDVAYIAVATMKTEKQVKALLNAFSMENIFDAVETAAENGGRSKAEMISAIVDILQVEKINVWMIGDTQGDKNAASEAGVNFIGAIYGYGFESDEKYSFKAVSTPGEILNYM